MAMSKFTVTFHGKKSHAALKPEAGRSALDALLLAFQAVEFLREHVPEDTRMHYTIAQAPGPVNVVPDTAVGVFSPAFLLPAEAGRRGGALPEDYPGRGSDVRRDL